MNKYRYEDNWDEIYANYVRNALTFYQPYKYEEYIESSKLVIKAVGEKVYLKSCFVTSYKLFIFIQMRLIRARNSKKRYMTQLRNLWNETVNKLFFKTMGAKSK